MGSLQLEVGAIFYREYSAQQGEMEEVEVVWLKGDRAGFKIKAGEIVEVPVDSGFVVGFKTARKIAVAYFDRLITGFEEKIERAEKRIEDLERMKINSN